MGSCGSSSKSSKKMTGKNANGQNRAFYDMTDKFAGMSMHEFENAIRDRAQEVLGGFDADGKLVVAGTSNANGSVVVPVSHPNFGDITTLTHNRPSNANRPVGGTLSEADVKVLATYPNLNSIRAVASGKAENTYIMQKSANKKANRAGLLRDTISAEYTLKLNKMGRKTVAKVEKKMGRPLTNAETSAAYIGGMKNAWKGIASKNGYDYVALKNVPW